MAITVEARTSLIELVVGMFGAAPGAKVLSDLVAAYEKGQTIKQIAANLANTIEFTTLFPTFLTNAEFATKVVNQLVGTEVVAAEKALAVTELTARLNAGASRSNVFVDAIDALDAITSTNAAWANAGAALDNKVAAAVYYSVDKQLSPASLSAAQNVISGVTSVASTVTTANTASDGTASAGGTFLLTTGVDTLTGTSGNDTFNAGDIAGAAVWTTGDTINGGAGTGDVFNVISNAAITSPTAATVTGVETMSAISGSTVNLNTTGFTGLTALTINSVGGATQAITAATTTAVSATTSALAAAETISGGSSVTVVNTGVTATGSLAISGQAGAVSVTSTSSTVDTTVQGTITVTGGTTVSIAQVAGNAVATTTTAGAVTVNGNASTTEVTVTNSAPATADATTVGRVNGVVTIADANVATASDTLTKVTLTNYGASTIASNVLSTLNLKGATVASGTLGLNTTATDTSVRATTLALNLDGGSIGAISGTQAVKYTTVNVATSAATTVADVTLTAATTLNFSGAAIATLSAITDIGAVTALNSTGAGVKISGPLPVTTAVTGGNGVETLQIGVTSKAISLGGGNDVLTTTGIVATGGSVSAGDGTDTVVMTSAEAAVADNNSTFNTKFTGFETLRLSNELAATTTLDLAGINNVTTVELAAGSAAADSILSNLVSGGTVKFTAAATALNVGVANALFSAADVLNLNISSTAGINVGSITAANVETINIAAADASTASTGSTAVGHTATLVATAAKNIVVTGNNGLTLVNTGNVAVTNFDATGVVANGTADTAALLAVSFTGANTTASAVVTIKGGAGNDTLVGSASKDTITGGAGGDIVNGGMGQDTINTGTGRDVIRIISDVDASAGLGVQSTTAAPDIVNGFVLATATTAAADFSTAANFIASTAGGVNTSMVSIDLNSDGAGAGTNLAVAIEGNVTTATTAVSPGATYTVSSGILSLGGAGASAVDTLAEWLLEASAVAATDGETIGFVYGGDTYVFSQNAAGDSLVQLVGVAATSLVLASGATSLTAGAVVIGDSL